MTKPKRILSWLCWISLLLTACKKEFGSDFDHIIGKWKWIKSTHTWQDEYGISHTEIVNNSGISSDIYEIEFVKKGEVVTYTNGKKNKKYRVKDSHGTFISHFNQWGYTIELHHKSTIYPIYDVVPDVITISGFFPRTLGDYGISETSTKDEISNSFVRE